MASYHMAYKSGEHGKGGAHANYITREGRYSALIDKKKYEDLIYKESGNMPEWAKENPNEFWHAADDFERANGRPYTEIEVALPNELTPQQQKELVEEFINEQIGPDHAYTYAIHDKPATLKPNEKNTHAHIMFSERKNDGIEREKEQYFKRYNPKHPERGGAGKDREKWHGKDKPIEVAEAWANIQNRHLERYGHEARVDHRSLEAQKIEALERGEIEKAVILTRDPERHLGPKIAQQTIRELKQESAKGNTREERTELRVQYYEKESTNEKAKQASLARQYRKGNIELEKDKLEGKVEKIQQNLPIKEMKPETALKYSTQAYFLREKREVEKESSKLQKDLRNCEKISKKVEYRVRKAPPGPARDAALKEQERIRAWEVSLVSKIPDVKEREENLANKVILPDAAARIEQMKEKMMEKDRERIQKLHDLVAERKKPDHEYTRDELKSIVADAANIAKNKSEQLEKSKETLEKQILPDEKIIEMAKNVITKGEYDKLLTEKPHQISPEIAKERSEIAKEREKFDRQTKVHNLVCDETGDLNIPQHLKNRENLKRLDEFEKTIENREKALSDKISDPKTQKLIKLENDYKKRVEVIEKKLQSPEAKAKLKEIEKEIVRNDKPEIREQLSKINADIKTTKAELQDLKVLDQKLGKAPREQKFNFGPNKITLSNVSKFTRAIDKMVQNHGQTQAPKGYLQAHLAADDEPGKKKDPEIGV